MTNDDIEQLRLRARFFRLGEREYAAFDADLDERVADEVEKLRAENEALRGAIETPEIDDDMIDQEAGTNSWWELKFKVEALETALADARAALAKSELVNEAHCSVIEELRADLAAAKERLSAVQEVSSLRAMEAADMRAQRDAARAELAAFVEAIGFLSTLAPKMEIDVTNPMKMAKEIDATVRAELAARDWQPMATAPTDGTFILTALRVFSSHDKKFLRWDIQVVALEYDGTVVMTCGDDPGWQWEDFEFWKPVDIARIDALGKGDDK